MQWYWGKRREDEGEHGVREHGIKEAKRRKRHGKNKGTMGEASDMWENKRTDMATEGRIKMKQWSERKLYSGSDQASWPRDESGDCEAGRVSAGEAKVSS